ncbi:tRNA pseudouridine(55) synthase TruB [Calditrichota bacterium LG25]
MMQILKKNDPIDASLARQGFIALINKPQDWTSFDVVNKIRHALKIKKVGHAGTLDPFATGLLIVGAGRGTRALSQFMNLDKTYRAVIRLGVETDTYDVTGKVLKEQDTQMITRQDVEAVINEMRGEMLQVPPMYSAKKVKGQPLYKLARKGKQVERKPQKVVIHQAKMLNWQPPLVEVELTVSKGTYIRTYAHDLGQKLGVGAMLAELARTKIGAFCLEESFELNAFIENWKQTVGQGDEDHKRA